MGDSDTKKGDKVALQGDNTFTIRHAGAVLKFQFHAGTRSVELLSSEAEPGDSGDTGDVLPVFSSGKVIEILNSPDLAAYVFQKLSPSGSVFVSNVISDKKELKKSVIQLHNLSRELTNQYGFKPKFVFRVDGTVDTAAPDINDLMRSAEADYDLDAYIVSMPDITK